MSRALLFLQHFPGGAAPGRATGGGAACGMGSPGEAFMPTPGRFTVVRCEKSPYFRTSSYLEYGGEGGIDSLRSPLLGPSMGLAPAGPTQALFKNAPGVFVGAARSQARGLSNWRCQLSNPGRGFSSPPKACDMRKKSPHFHASSSSNMAVRGGFEPPIRCRIHTFQACSFSHSDTSPYCFAA